MRRVLIAPFVLAVACSGPEPERAPAATRAPLVAERDRLPEPGETLGRAAHLLDGSRVVSRAGDAPGESNLWLVSPNGSERELAPASGPDELPLGLPDGRVVFVSGRSGVASLWLLDPATGDVEQLTNRGLRAGHLSQAFVPPPLRSLELSGNVVVYDAGSARVEFDLVERVARVEAAR